METTTRKLSFPLQIQSTDQTSSKFIDRFIHLKTRYWNRGYAIVLLTLICLTIQWFLNQAMIYSCMMYDYSNEYIISIAFGYSIGCVSGGVLATIYPPYKVFGISFIVSLLFQIMEATNYANMYLRIFSLFFIEMTLAMAISASHRIYTFWVPLKKQSLFHFPIVLWTMIMNNQVQIGYNYNYILILLVLVGIPCFVMWLIVIGGDHSQSKNSGFILFRLFNCSNTVPRSSETDVVSLRQPTMKEIPWKSFCTSMPVIAIALSYMGHSYHPLEFNDSLENYTLILLLLIFVLAELIPEIAVCFSVTTVRKIFGCLYFVSMSIIYYLKAFPNNGFLILENSKYLVKIIFDLMTFLSFFGFQINHLDIAPQYSSVLYGFLISFYYIAQYFSPSKYLDLIFEEPNAVQYHILGAVISLLVAVFYAIFASAELQPWAVDKTVKENQRNMKEEEFNGCATVS